MILPFDARKKDVEVQRRWNIFNFTSIHAEAAFSGHTGINTGVLDYATKEFFHFFFIVMAKLFFEVVPKCVTASGNSVTALD